MAVIHVLMMTINLIGVKQMIKIVIGIIIIIFIYILLIVVSLIKRRINKTKTIKEKEQQESKEKYYNNKPVYNNSALNFDEITIKNRYYLNTFINEINSKLPSMSREKKELVDVKTHVFNKTFYKND